MKTNPSLRLVSLLLVVCAVIVPSCTPAATAATNYYDTNLMAIVNGSFESPEVGGLLGWHAFGQSGNGSTFATTTLRKKVGAHSAVITSRFPTRAELWQEIPTLRPHSHYRLSGWIKTSNVISPTGSTTAGAHLDFVVPNVISFRNPVVQGTADWQFIEIFFEFPVPSYRLPLVVARLGDASDPAQGTAFFDDLQLAEVNPLRFVGTLGNLAATNGIPAVLRVEVFAAGSPLGFQWWKDGAPIPAATNAAITFNSPQAVDAGYYSVVVSNHVANSITSNPVRVDVLYPLRFSGILENLAATNGIPALLTADVYAPGSLLGFQWWKDGAPIPMATNAVLAFNSPKADDVGYYLVVVSNHLANSITSNPALMDVFPGDGSVVPSISDLETSPAVFKRHAIAITETLHIVDQDVGRLTGATIKFTGNYILREDYLSFSATAGTVPFSYFLADDLSNLAALAWRVTQSWKWNPVDLWLAGQLSAETRSALEKYQSGTPDMIQATRLVLQDLNAILQGPAIYDDARFRYVGLRDETRRLLSMNPQGADVGRLNRLLLEDAYPVELRRHGISGRFDPASGTLTLAGRDTVANYQAALRSVRYVNPRSIRNGRDRTISVTVTDGVRSSSAGTRIIAMAASPARSEIVAWGSDGAGQATVPPGLSNAVAVAVGDNHSLALLANGTVVAWGASGAPATQVPSGLSNVVSIAAGGEQSYALKSDGQVVGWGSQSVPADLSDAIAIAAGTDHGLAMLSDGSLRGWGGKLFHWCYESVCDFRICQDDDTGAAIPPGGTDYIALAGGLFHSLALKADGSVSGFGGYLIGSSTPDEGCEEIPIFGLSLPKGLMGVREFAAGGNTSKFLLSDGTVAFAGSDPGPAGGLSNIVALSPFAAITTAGEAVSWGPLGPAPQLSNVVQIASSYHALAIIAVPLTPTNQPPIITALETTPLAFSRFAVPLTTALRIEDPDDSHLTGATVAITRNYSRFEDVLVFPNTDSITGAFNAATGVLTLQGRATLAAYQSALRSVKYINSRAIRSDAEREIRFAVGPAAVATRALRVRPTVHDGVLYSWSEPIPNNLGPVVSVARGWDFTIALRADGTVAAWGSNDQGQTSVPAGLRDVVAIDAGDAHALALKADGTVVAWGGNEHYGYVDYYGIVDGGQTDVPIGLTEVTAISAGGYHSLALRADGTMVGWGSNLGPAFDDFINYSGQATPPPGIHGLVSVAGGRVHSLMLRADGIPDGWGDWGVDDDVFTAVPRWNGGLRGVRAIAGAGLGSAFLFDDQTAAFWAGVYFYPVTFSNVVAISDSLVLKADGTVASWSLYNQPPSPIPSNVVNVVEIPVHGGGIAILIPAAPAALPLSVTGREDTDLVVTLAGSDPTPADGLIFKITTGSFNGTLYQCNNGLRGAPITTTPAIVTDAQHRVIYAPGPQGNGSPFDSFQFAVVDGARMSAPARVTINITAVNDPPIAGFGMSLAIPGSGSAELTRPPFASPTSDFTIETWVRNSVLNDGYYHGILGRHLAGGTTNRSPSLWQGPDRGALHLDSLATDGRRFGLLLPSFFRETGAWLHLALVKQGTTYRIYRNGHLFGAGPAPTAVRILANGFSFGRVDNYFRGHLDDIRIWQTARTETEIRADAYRPLTGKESALLGAWSCNEGGGKVLRDLSPGRNHARLNGNAGFSSLTPPLAWETPRGVTLAGWLPAADFEGDQLRFSIVIAPRSGTLLFAAGGSFTYTPRPGFTGIDTFTYRVNDGRLNSSSATVTLRVTGTSALAARVAQTSAPPGSLRAAVKATASANANAVRARLASGTLHAEPSAFAAEPTSAIRVDLSLTSDSLDAQITTPSCSSTYQLRSANLAVTADNNGETQLEGTATLNAVSGFVFRLTLTRDSRGRLQLWDQATGTLLLDTGTGDRPFSSLENPSYTSE